MRIFLTIFFTTLFLFLTATPSLTQEYNSEEEEQITTKISETHVKEEAVQEKEENNKLQSLTEKIEEETPNPRNSFWTIFGAILIPSIFIIFIYYLLKSFKF